MIFSMAKRTLFEIDKRILWKFAWNCGYKGMRSIQKFQKRLKKGISFPPFVYMSITNACQLRCQGCWVDVDRSLQMMTLEELNSIITEAQTQGLPFLIIGGQALALHGHARMTYDIDFVIPSSDLVRWRSLLFKHGYITSREEMGFEQFKNIDGEIPIDLMLANHSTFSKLSAESMEKDWKGAQVRVPAPLHLIAMKLHSLKNEHRFAKDFGDVGELMRIHNIDFHSLEFQAILDRYASQKIRDLLATHANSSQ